jgi:DNA polymerase III subunit delta
LSKLGIMDAFSFLDRPRRQSLFVVVGDEDLLRRLVFQAIRAVVLGPDDDGFSYSAHAGDKATFAAVMDELQTVPFFGESRLVVVENADPFVTRYRAALEKAVTDLPKSGVLVLDVKSWPSNTRLAKLVAAAATLTCKGPAAHKLPDWCAKWTKSRYAKQIVPATAELLVELVGADMGVLDQELAKLAIYVGDRSCIDAEDVDRLVGRSRLETTWKIFDAIGAGQSAQALTIFDRLLDQGEDPMRILGAFSYQLRPLAQAARLALQGKPLSLALEQVGVQPFKVRACEQQLKHLGRERAAQLYDWLLEIDQGVKGSSQLPPRTQLERLLLRLARDP